MEDENTTEVKTEEPRCTGSALNDLLSCPFCGEIPKYPSGYGTQYEIECNCGQAMACVQICDLMTIEERTEDQFVDHRYRDKYIERAKIEATKMWNARYTDRKYVTMPKYLWKMQTEELEVLRKIAKTAEGFIGR